MTRVVWIRVCGIAFIAATAWYIPWVLATMDSEHLWLGIPFLVATLLLVAGALLALVNNWSRSEPPVRLVAPGDEPLVAVIVTTAGEPASLVERTARSVLRQDWPHDRTWLILSDDGGDPALRDLARRLAAEHPAARVEYNRPPLRGSAERVGDAKAGNLNSALALVSAHPSPPAFVETRDADDLVLDPMFLRHTVGQLASDPRMAFVQTMKTAQVSEGDPFANESASFFRGSMFGRQAANAVFPCGSGLLWRVEALQDIGGFPTWNLVEDLQSGIEALRRGWRGCYLPIYGAHSQAAPEDIPNVYKQRGTWAVDTIRLLLWHTLRGLTLRQRLQFWELGLFYLQSFAVLAIIAMAALGLLVGVYPLESTWTGHTIHFWPFALTLEALLAALFAGATLEAYLKERELWIGLAPVFAKACIVAVVRGRGGRLSYRVTRKDARFAWYWRETLPQAVLVAALVAGILHAIATRGAISELDLATVYWACLFAGFLGAFVTKGWFGTASPLARMLGRGAPAGQPGGVPPVGEEAVTELTPLPSAASSASQAGLGE